MIEAIAMEGLTFISVMGIVWFSIRTGAEV